MQALQGVLLGASLSFRSSIQGEKRLERESAPHFQAHFRRNEQLARRWKNGLWTHHDKNLQAQVGNGKREREREIENPIFSSASKGERAKYDVRKSSFVRPVDLSVAKGQRESLSLSRLLK